MRVARAPPPGLAPPGAGPGRGPPAAARSACGMADLSPTPRPRTSRGSGRCRRAKPERWGRPDPLWGPAGAGAGTNCKCVSNSRGGFARPGQGTRRERRRGGARVSTATFRVGCGVAPQLCVLGREQVGAVEITASGRAGCTGHFISRVSKACRRPVDPGGCFCLRRPFCGAGREGESVDLGTRFGRWRLPFHSARTPHPAPARDAPGLRLSATCVRQRQELNPRDEITFKKLTC